jgi:predicted MFS family arabinose efflux permease
MPAIGNAVGQVYSKGYRAWLLTVLMAMNALNLTDRQLMASMSQAIKLDIRITDAQLGIIQGFGFAIFYTFFGLAIARAAEHFSRTRIIAASIGLFGVMVSLCSSAHSFARLLLFRVGVGVGDAGFGPPVASLIGDHYKMDRRAPAMAIIWLGAPLGAVTGAAFGGWMAEQNSWRTAFVIVGVVGLCVGLIAFLSLREPPRGMSDPAGVVTGAPPSTLEMLKFMLAKPSMRQFLIGCGLAATAMNGIGQFFLPFMVRNYHIGSAEAGRFLALVAGVGMASGLVIGGFGVGRAGRSDKRWYAWAPAIGLVLSALFFVLGFAQPTAGGAVGLLVLAHVALFVYYTPTLAIAQNMVGASMRASSGFLISVVLGLVGIGLGPTLVGFLSDAYATHAFAIGSYASMCPKGLPPPGAAADLAAACRDASASGIRHALMTAALIAVWGAIHYMLAARQVRADLEKLYVPKEPPAGTL